MRGKIERIWENPEAIGEVAKGNPIVSFHSRELSRGSARGLGGGAR